MTCPTCSGTGNVCKHCGVNADHPLADCEPWLRRGGDHSLVKCKACAGTGKRNVTDEEAKAV